jgi:hypothetical protein
MSASHYALSIEGSHISKHVINNDGISLRRFYCLLGFLNAVPQLPRLHSVNVADVSGNMVSAIWLLVVNNKMAETDASAFAIE